MVRRSSSLRRRPRQVTPWSNHIPSEILDQIALKCATSDDPYISLHQVTLRRVCRAWYRSLHYSTPLLPLPSPRIPLLLLPHPSADLNTPLGYIYTLTFRLRHPNRRRPETDCPSGLKETHGCICVGSSHGWLITLSLDSSTSLLNPITRESIRLAPLSSIDNTVLSFICSSSECHLPKKRKFRSQASIIRRAILSSDPAKDPGFTVLLFFSGLTDRCYMCTKDSVTWRPHLHEPFLVEDVIFFNGVFVAIDLSANLAFFDFTKLNTVLVKNQQKDILSWSPDEAFLVESVGKLLVVVKRVALNQKRFLRGSTRVYEIVMPDGVNIVCMRSLSQCSLFIGHGCSVSVSKRHFQLLPEGMVYFPHSYTDEANVEAGVEIIKHHAGVYEFTLETRTTCKKFVVENRKVNAEDLGFAHSRFFWVTPNLNRI